MAVCRFSNKAQLSSASFSHSAWASTSPSLLSPQTHHSAQVSKNYLYQVVLDQFAPWFVPVSFVCCKTQNRAAARQKGRRREDSRAAVLFFNHLVSFLSSGLDHGVTLRLWRRTRRRRVLPLQGPTKLVGQAIAARHEAHQTAGNDVDTELGGARDRRGCE